MLNQKSFVIITGASRGFGRALACEMVSKVQPGSLFLLLSRNLFGLEETRDLMLTHTEPSAVTIVVKSMDNSLASFEDFVSGIEGAQMAGQDFDLAAIFHNAGSLGPQGTLVKNLNHEETLQSYFAANLFSVMKLNSAFMNRTRATVRLIVNTSSLAALQPFSTMSMYCMGKASRDMLFKVLSEELKDHAGWRILNYAPGPLDTDMVKEILTDKQTDPEIRKHFMELTSSGRILSPKSSAQRLMQILEEDTFSNGDHVDYFDSMTSG